MMRFDILNEEEYLVTAESAVILLIVELNLRLNLSTGARETVLVMEANIVESGWISRSSGDKK